MTTTTRIASGLAAIAATLALAACGSDSNGGASGAAAAGGSSKTVSVKEIDGTKVLVDSGGRALYAPDQEKSGTIRCTGACTDIWKPLAASGTPSGDAKLGTVKRPDGSTQVTYGGRPLYTFTQEGAGKVTGDGVTDSFGGTSFTWHVIATTGKPSGGSSSSSSDSGGRGGYTY